MLGVPTFTRKRECSGVGGREGVREGGMHVRHLARAMGRAIHVSPSAII
jgi:hypothetical protein